MKLGILFSDLNLVTLIIIIIILYSTLEPGFKKLLSDVKKHIIDSKYVLIVWLLGFPIINIILEDTALFSRKDTLLSIANQGTIILNFIFALKFYVWILFIRLIFQLAQRSNPFFLLFRSVISLGVVSIFSYIILSLNNNPIYRLEPEKGGIFLLKLIVFLLASYLSLVENVIIFSLVFLISIAALCSTYFLIPEIEEQEKYKLNKIEDKHNIIMIIICVLIYLPIFSQFIKI